MSTCMHELRNTLSRRNRAKVRPRDVPGEHWDFPKRQKQKNNNVDLFIYMCMCVGCHLLN